MMDKTTVPFSASWGLFFAGSIFLGGCMMVPMHGRMEHGAGHAMSGGHVIKEVQKDGFAVTLEVPPLSAGRESTITVTMKDLATGKSTGSYDATVLIEKTGSPERTSLERDVTRNAVAERTLFKYTFQEPGPHQITANVSLPGSTAAPLTVSVKQEVMPKEKPRHKGTGRWILGGLGMAAMMALMLL